jgi:perosamine synthetase
MKRFTEIERRYVLEALDNEFATSKNSIFCSRMEKKFAEIHNVQFAIGHVNGTQTMHTALAALGIGAGDEVIVPPLTMSSTSLAVLHNGSIPVFADVCEDTFNIDPKSIRSRITSKTKAIMPVALYGLAPDYDEINDICNSEKLYLIEDNAEALLATYKGKKVGEFGHFASYSFQASKHITCGEGGILITNDEDLADKARKFGSLGYAGVGSKQGKISKNDIQNPNYLRHVSLGFNYRMSEVNAAVILGQLERIDELVEQRIKVAAIFDQVIKNQTILKKQFIPDKCNHTYWSYSLIIDSNKPEFDWYRFRNLFQKNGGDGFYAAWRLTYHEPFFKNNIQKQIGIWQNYNKSLCPNAEYLQPRMIQLKTNYWDLKEAEKQAEILDKTIRDF